MKAKVKILDAFKITGRGVVAACEITEGSVNRGDVAVFGENEYEILSVEMGRGVGLGLILKADDFDGIKAEVKTYINEEITIK